MVNSVRGCGFESPVAFQERVFYFRACTVHVYLGVKYRPEYIGTSLVFWDERSSSYTRVTLLRRAL